ncbi:MAG TPA: glycosyltransferase family 4 protein [Cyclobacteriaceae bacterium]|nr:glycosyltransferase family 4 protein [Cyclobacteriaceae bacterium]
MEQVKRIVMIANPGHRAFDPRVFQKEARALANAGFDVTFLVPHEKDDERDGVKILSVPRYPKGWKKLITSPWLLYRRALRLPKDSIFQLHDSELLWIGVLLKLRGRRIIYDAHEDTPLQISYQHWIPKLLRKPYAWFYYLLEKFCGRLFDSIIIAEPVIQQYFPKSKTTLVRNFPILAQFTEPTHPYTSRSKNVIYVGLVSKVRGAIEMAEAAKIANAPQNITMTFVGDFSPGELKDEVIKKYPVVCIQWTETSQLMKLFMDAMAGMIVPHPIERYKTNYPVKVFEYMAAGMPVIASKHGESARFVEEANAGILVEPMDPKEIADAIQWLLDHPEEAAAMGKRGRQLILEKYNWEKESQSLINLYHTLFSKK